MTQSQLLSPPKQVNPAEACSFLERLIKLQTKTEALDWLYQQRQNIKEEGERKLFISFSLASRYFESKTIELSVGQQEEADQLRPGFMPQHWTQLQTARALLLLELDKQNQDQFVLTLTRLAETADVAEQTALYAALPILPFPQALRKRASEGIRTNMTVVFDAIALHNPYPADYLEERAWNQMVLKAVFMGRPLYKIWGADKRANPTLAQMLLDFAHERWAAHRTVTPELWRFIGPYIRKDSFADLERVSREGTPMEKEAVLLACASSSFPQAKQLLDQQQDIERKIKGGEISWSRIGQQHHGL